MLPSFDNDPHFPPVCPIFGHTGVCVWLHKTPPPTKFSRAQV